MDVAAVARCAGRCYVSPAFGESRNLRPSLSDSRSLEPAGLKFRGKSQRRLSFFRRIMATDESISARRGETQQINGNVVWHACPITKSDRQELIKQKGCVIWITGLSGSGLIVIDLLSACSLRCFCLIHSDLFFSREK